MTKPLHLSASDVRNRLRKACEQAGAQAQWAINHDVSPQFVNDVLNDRRAPGPAITRALGLIENPRTWMVDKIR